MQRAVERSEALAPWECGCGRPNPMGDVCCTLCGTRKGDSFESRVRENPGAAFMDGYVVLCERYGASPVDVYIRNIDACCPAEVADILACIERQLRDEG